MHGKPKKTPRQKNLTEDYLSGSLDEDRVEQQQRFTDRNKNAQRDKMLKTSVMRADQMAATAEVDGLPTGQVIQIHSMYCDVKHDDRTYLCVIRKTLTKVHGDIVVGDFVRFRISADASTEASRAVGVGAATGAPDAVIEHVLPRKTLLTRADSFKAVVSHPIVANAQQVLVVASVSHPQPKWGLIDRMIVASRAGGLTPIICLNKIDLPDEDDDAKLSANAAIDYYASIGYKTIRASAESAAGIELLRAILKDHETVLAGHSGVGKSSLIRALQPALDLRVGEVSRFTEKGRHTTTSARRYPLEFGGAIIDTPGVKLFGLWNVTPENLLELFPDVDAGAAPKWRLDSYNRILESLTHSR